MKLRGVFLYLVAAQVASADPISTGTGFFIDDTHVLTCAHCVNGSSEIIMVRSDNSNSKGAVVFADEELDIAVVRTDARSPDALGMGDSGTVKLLDDLYVFGFPLASKLGSELSASHGKLNSRRSFAGRQLLQLDAAINPGNSGGPVINSSGQVVGMAVARLDPLKMAKDMGTIPERINFAIPSAVIRTRLTRANLVLPQSQQSNADLAERAAKATVLLISIGQDEESPSASQEPSQESLSQAAVADRRLRDAAAEYIESGNAPTVERELEPYAERVDFYEQGIKTSKEIREEISRQRKRWTSRHYQFERVVRTQYDPVKDIGTVIVRYAYAVSSGNKRRDGNAESLIVYSSVSTVPKVVLVREHRFQDGEK